MLRILMILAFCTLASAPKAQTELTPALFDLQDQFNHCLSDPQTASYHRCFAKLQRSFTLRREIGNALQACLKTNDCVAQFDAAGLPTDTKGIAILDHCTRLGDLEVIDISHMPENACIEIFADQIERESIPTQHDVEILCSKTYIACIEIFKMSAEYWKTAGWNLLFDKQYAIVDSDESAPEIRFQRYSLLERQHTERVALAITTCELQTLGQQRNSARDVEECLGHAYADIWIAMQTE